MKKTQYRFNYVSRITRGIILSCLLLAQEACASTRFSFTREFDRKLIQAYAESSKKSRWKQIANKVSTDTIVFSGKQCRERYMEHLHPKIKKGPATEDEKALLIRAVREYGTQFALISRERFTNPASGIYRTQNFLKNLYYANLCRRIDFTKKLYPDVRTKKSKKRKSNTLVESVINPVVHEIAPEDSRESLVINPAQNKRVRSTADMEEIAEPIVHDDAGICFTFKDEAAPTTDQFKYFPYLDRVNSYSLKLQGIDYYIRDDMFPDFHKCLTPIADDFNIDDLLKDMA
jgi:hypothetical protein